ncbi:MAG: hypothetical protein QXD48_00210 [Candidatus Aenigmatarchaeota archaeon]
MNKKNLKKVYLPKWTAWFMLIVLIPILRVIEYEAFYGKDQYPIMGIVVGFLFLALLVMLFVVAYKKIPYMFIEN